MLKALFRTRIAALFYSVFRGSRRKKPRSPAGKIGAGILGIYVIGCMFWLFGMLWVSMCEPFYRIGLSWLYFAIVAAMAVLICFIGSVFMAQKQLFAAKDNDLLLSMPIPPAAIITSRMLMLLMLNYMIEAVVVLPAAFVWCQSLPVTAAGAVIFVLAFLLLPFLPLTLSCLFGWIIEAVSSHLSRGKNILTMLLSIAFLAAYFIVYSKMQEYIAVLIANGKAVGEAVKQVAPPFYWLGDAIAAHNVGSLLLFILCCIVPFAIACFIIAKSFISIATRKVSGAKRVYHASSIKVGSADSALLGREVRHFLSSAMYMLNAGIGLVMLLIACVALVIKYDAVLDMLAQMDLSASFLPELLCAAQCLILAMTYISASSISLEGKTLWIAQSLPVPPYSILRAKVRMHFYIALPFSLISSVILALASKAGGLILPVMFVLPALLCLVTAQLGVLINLRFPKFDWTNETIAVKQSISVIVSMLVNWGLIILPVVLFVILPGGSIAPDLYMALWTLVFIPAAMLLDKALRGWGVQAFEELAA